MRMEFTMAWKQDLNKGESMKTRENKTIEEQVRENDKYIPWTPESLYDRWDSQEELIDEYEDERGEDEYEK